MTYTPNQTNDDHPEERSHLEQVNELDTHAVTTWKRRTFSSGEAGVAPFLDTRLLLNWTTVEHVLTNFSRAPELRSVQEGVRRQCSRFYLGLPYQLNRQDHTPVQHYSEIFTYVIARLLLALDDLQDVPDETAAVQDHRQIVQGMIADTVKAADRESGHIGQQLKEAVIDTLSAKAAKGDRYLGGLAAKLQTGWDQLKQVPQSEPVNQPARDPKGRSAHREAMLAQEQRIIDEFNNAYNPDHWKHSLKPEHLHPVVGQAHCVQLESHLQNEPAAPSYEFHFDLLQRLATQDFRHWIIPLSNRTGIAKGVVEIDRMLPDNTPAKTSRLILQYLENPACSPSLISWLKIPTETSLKASTARLIDYYERLSQVANLSEVQARVSFLGDRDIGPLLDDGHGEKLLILDGVGRNHGREKGNRAVLYHHVVHPSFIHLPLRNAAAQFCETKRFGEPHQTSLLVSSPEISVLLDQQSHQDHEPDAFFFSQWKSNDDGGSSAGALPPVESTSPNVTTSTS